MSKCGKGFENWLILWKDKELKNGIWVKFWNMSKSFPGSEVEARDGYGKRKDYGLKVDISWVI